ncbi:MAG: SAM-dependent methyltransferase [Planctomycetaceae bacterium]
MSMTSWGALQAERGRLPDWMTRMGIRKLLADRLAQPDNTQCERNQESIEAFVALLKNSPVALVPEKANEQHYEVPPAFFQQVLGRRRKYSSCLWDQGVTTLDHAEERALAVTCERAQLFDGARILELGCGWGSLTLWMAENYPRAQITAVSNSAPQRQEIESLARDRGLTNVQVVTADMNDFAPEGLYDRVVSVEMFEHMRNYEELLRRISTWLKPGGRLVVHIFTHDRLAYPFETDGPDDWMGKYFFTGGIMPSDGLLHRFQRDLDLLSRWRWNGTHYARTCNAWLALQDARKPVVMPILAKAYGEADADLWFHRWRVFFMACAELFDYAGGEEWGVSHYLFGKA